MADGTDTPVWAWLPGADEPIHAGQFKLKEGVGHVVYDQAYRDGPGVALDPVHLPNARRTKGIPVTINSGYPGVFVDAAPAGYGADRLSDAAGRKLNMLELLQAGLPDGAGAIEVCENVEKKLEAWAPPALDSLMKMVSELEDTAPSSRAIRNLLNEESTSAGGEKPKITVQDDGRLWLAKLQDRGEAAHLPEREFVVMELASAAGLDVPDIRLLGDETRKVFLIERFDRGGDPRKPTRLLYASAHTVLGLDGADHQDHPRRSYLVLADEMRKWAKGHDATADCQELWRRMAFNVLVGNTDDHPRNHALIQKDGRWRLSKAFDITPLPGKPGFLSMACDENGIRDGTPERLLRSAAHFGYGIVDAAEWLGAAARLVAHEWRERMTKVGVDEVELTRVAPAFRASYQLAEDPDALPAAVEAAQVKPVRRR